MPESLPLRVALETKRQPSRATTVAEGAFGSDRMQRDNPTREQRSRIEARAGAWPSRVRAVELDETWRALPGLGILDLTLRFEWERAPESFVGVVRRCVSAVPPGGGSMNACQLWTPLGGAVRRDDFARADRRVRKLRFIHGRMPCLCAVGRARRTPTRCARVQRLGVAVPGVVMAELNFVAPDYAAASRVAAVAPSSIAPATTANAARQACSCSDRQAEPATAANAAISASPTTG